VRWPSCPEKSALRKSALRARLKVTTLASLPAHQEPIVNKLSWLGGVGLLVCALASAQTPMPMANGVVVERGPSMNVEQSTLKSYPSDAGYVARLNGQVKFLKQVAGLQTDGAQAIAILRLERNAAVLEQHQAQMLGIEKALSNIRRQAEDLSESAQAVLEAELAAQAAPARVSAAATAAVLSQRVSRSASELLDSLGQISPEAVFLLGKDLTALKAASDTLTALSDANKVAPARIASQKERAIAFEKGLEKVRTEARNVLNNLVVLVDVSRARKEIALDLAQFQTAIAAR
jgi:hypothetical protein